VAILETVTFDHAGTGRFFAARKIAACSGNRRRERERERETKIAFGG
jgi:hypothetical protein